MAGQTHHTDELFQIARTGDARTFWKTVVRYISLPPALSPVEPAVRGLLRAVGALEEPARRARLLTVLVETVAPWLEDEDRPQRWARATSSSDEEDVAAWARTWAAAYGSALGRIEPDEPEPEATLEALARALSLWTEPSLPLWFAQRGRAPDLPRGLFGIIQKIAAMRASAWQALALEALANLLGALYALREVEDPIGYIFSAWHFLEEIDDDRAIVKRLRDVTDNVQRRLESKPGIYPTPGAPPIAAPPPIPEPSLPPPAPSPVPKDIEPEWWQEYKPGVAGEASPGEASEPPREDEVQFGDEGDEGINFSLSEVGEPPGQDELWLEEEAPPAGEEPNMEEQVPPAEPTPRYADFTFLTAGDGGAGPALPDGQVLRAEQPYYLEVAVRAAPTGIPVESGERRPVREPKQKEPVTIMVTAEGDGFDIDEPVQTLTLPPKGDSTQNALFRVWPRRLSTQTNDRAAIQVRLYYQFNLLEVAIIRAEVVGKFDDLTQSKLGLDRPISFVQERLEGEYLDFDHIQPRAMHIDITRQGEHYLFHFAFYNEADQKLVFTAPARLTPEDLEDELVGIRDTWYKIAMSRTFTQGLEGDEDEFRRYIRELARAGRGLWTRLFEHEPDSALYQIGAWLEGHPLKPGGILQISLAQDAADFVFPWALIYDRPVPRKEYELPDLEGFWGVRYVIEQKLPAPRKGTDEPVRVEPQLKLGFMLWEQFRNAREQQDLMKKLVASSGGKLAVSDPPIVDADACFELLTQGDAHLLYFYTHGYTRQRRADIGVGPDFDRFIRWYEALAVDDPMQATHQPLYQSIKQNTFEADRSWIELSYGKLYLDELYDGVRKLPSSPLVILNMCESAQVTPSLSESFFHFFLSRGASAVIGTECPMTVEFAHPFAEKFLADLLSGQPVGEALREARRHFLSKKNPLGLAYTLFGRATLDFEPPSLPVP